MTTVLNLFLKVWSGGGGRGVGECVCVCGQVFNWAEGKDGSYWFSIDSNLISINLDCN